MDGRPEPESRKHLPETPSTKKTQLKEEKVSSSDKVKKSKGKGLKNRVKTRQ